MDWNEDGLKDLLVGGGKGKLTLYLNIGAKGSPVLENRGYLNAGSGPVNVQEGAAPVFTDWNNDGRKDLLVGNFDGYLYYYQNVGTNDAPIYRSPNMIEISGEPLLVWRCSPEVYDLNRDGKKDLIIGERNGRVLFLENKNTDDSPRFTEYVELQANGSVLDPGSAVKIDIADWNEDGLDDIILGEIYGNIIVYLNRGIPTGFDDKPLPRPESFRLEQNYPNPFNPVTTIRFSLQKPANVSLIIYNSVGQRVKTLVTGFLPKGEFLRRWDGKNDSGSNVSSGVYFYCLEAGKVSRTMKMILIR